MKNSDEPAFGFHERSNDNSEGQSFMGLTKREFLAAKAMQGLLSNPAMAHNSVMGVNGGSEVGHIALSEVIKAGLEIADELLKQLEK